jgi:membrane associated rhomboid family serine protease
VAYGCLLNPWRMIIVFAEFLPLPLPALLYGGAFLAKDLGALFDVHIPYVSDRAQGIAHGAHVGGTLVCSPASLVHIERETMTISTPDVVRARL